MRYQLPPELGGRDLLTAESIEHLWREGDGRSMREDVLSALCHRVPRLRHQFPASWRLLSAWKKVELPCRAPPLTPTILFALVELSATAAD